MSEGPDWVFRISDTNPHSIAIFSQIQHLLIGLCILLAVCPLPQVPPCEPQHPSVFSGWCKLRCACRFVRVRLERNEVIQKVFDRLD